MQRHVIFTLVDDTYDEFWEAYVEEYGCDDDDVLCQDPTEEPTDSPSPVPPDTNSPTQTATEYEYEYDDDDYSVYAYPMYEEVLLFGALNVGNDITESMNSKGAYHDLADQYHRLVAVSTLESYNKSSVCKIEYCAFDGLLYSESDTIDIELHPPAHLPTVEEQTFNLDEDNDLIFPILTSDVQETQTMVLTVKSLPVDVDENGVPAGKLFHADGREVTLADSGSPTITQFVSGGTFSSEWDSAGYNFESGILGEPDLWPSFGDRSGAWQPSEEGDFVNQWLELIFDVPVYISRSDIYETWAPFVVMEIFSKDYDDDDAKWVSIWHRIQHIDFREPGDYTSNIDDLNLCPTTFRSNTIKLTIQLRGEAYWYAIDAVSISGAKEIGQNILSSAALKYSPALNSYGSFVASIEVSDCPYYLNNRRTSADKRTGEVRFVVNSLNDVPDINEHIFTVDGANNTSIKLADYYSDQDGKEDPLTVTILVED